MNQNQARMYTNNLSAHASLLLSASPTIITSPLQNNTNNPQTSPALTTNAPVRRQPSTPLLAAPVSNLDNEAPANTDTMSNANLAEGYINFKKPQNEIFKKLDGKIQKIVAAHSNLNKLYALNDFSSLGAKRPFELPPQLPPPPPWIPKVAAEYGCGQWSDEAISRLNSNYAEHKPSSSVFDSTKTQQTSPPLQRKSNTTPTNNKTSSLTIDSAISKLHQRRQQQHASSNQNPTDDADSPHMLPSSSCTSVSSSSTPKISPAQFSVLAQKIKETVEAESKFVLSKEPPRLDKMTEGEKKEYKAGLYALLAKEYVLANQERGTNSPTGKVQLKPKQRVDSMTPEERKKFFQEELVTRIKHEIASVTRELKLAHPVQQRNSSPQGITSEQQKSLLMKSPNLCPQSLFNTIRRETSLLLNKRENARPNNQNASLLTNLLPVNRQKVNDNLNTHRPPITKLQQTVKVIISPTEIQNSAINEAENKVSTKNENFHARNLDKPVLSYQVIKNKIKLFQESNRIRFGRTQRFQAGTLDGFGKKRSQKSIDKIVDQLQAKCSNTPVQPDASMQKANFQQQIIYSSASLLQTSRSSPLSAPTPIPVFRSPYSASSKSGYFQAGASKIVNLKSKKSKRFHLFGLKLSNYLERECPQPTNEKITIEQFAKCLNLVRANDVSLQRQQEQLSRSDRWRLPVTNRPLRLRRIRGERIHMPASASYKATRRVGLQ